MTALDDIIESLSLGSGRRIRLLKIAVEGAEVAAIRGARKLLEAKRIDYMYALLHPKHLALMGHCFEDFHSVMRSYDYRSTKTRHPAIFLYTSPNVEPLPERLSQIS